MTSVAVRERPILFSGEMVRAILDGRKTQTRRVVTPQPNNPDVFGVSPVWGYGVHKANASLPGAKPGRFCLHAAFSVDGKRVDRFLPCPYGQPGDRLWVRECFSYVYGQRTPQIDTGFAIWYWADGPTEHGDWTKPKPSIHMPRWASRITLEITNVRVQRVQEISENDAQDEGVNEFVEFDGLTAADLYRQLWDSLNAERAPWAANPFVWVLEFKAVES